MDGEDDGDTDVWTPVSSGKGGQKKGENRQREGSMKGSQHLKRSLEGNSSDEGNRVICKKMVRGEFKIILKFRMEDEQISLSPIALSREVKKKIGEVEMAKVLRDGNLLIICKTEEQKNKAMLIESICKKMINEKRLLGENRVTRGAITGIPVDEDLEKLKRSMYGGEVSRMKRLLRTVNGERVDSLSVLIEFQGSVLPERVKVGCMSFQVRPYIPPPLRCYKCQRYGHIAAVCKGKQRCPKCGEDHRVEDCKENVKDKCCNCG